MRSIGFVAAPDLLATRVSTPWPLAAHQAEDSFDASHALFSTPSSGPSRDVVILQDAHAVYAIREGAWKLVERSTTPPVEPRNQNAARRRAQPRAAASDDELYNLATDPGETKDAAAEHRDVVQRLRRRLVESRSRGYTRPGAG